MQKVAVALIFALLVAGCVGQTQQSPETKEPTEKQTESKTQEIPFQSKYSVNIQNIRTPHFVNSAPAHGDIYATVPKEIVINTNFDLAPPSEIKVFRGDVDATDGTAQISQDRLSMRVSIKGSGDGEYIVKYKGCWPDGSCHDGSFGFIVDSAFLTQMQDLRGQSSVNIDMSDIKFSPQYVRISKGTKITFVNNDQVEHFVNTDPHPSHNYLAGLNSRGIQNGNNFEYTFDTSGEQHYHCSAHANVNMNGIILVE